MTPTERRTASQNLLARSDDEFNNGGDTMIAAELLWGAVAQHLLAAGAVQQPPKPISRHSFYGHMATELAAQDPSKQWQSEFAAADQLHRHFYHRNLKTNDLTSRRAAAKRLVANADGYMQAKLAPTTAPPTTTRPT